MNAATRICALLALFLLAGPLFAQEKEPLVFESPEEEARYQQMTYELRCLVCQNQNLADSDAPLAQQLRAEIFGMMQEGQSNDDIIRFMVDRYGDFVLYRPPLQANTVVLWLFPVLLLLVGAVIVFITVRNRGRKLAAQDPEGAA